MVPGWRRGFYFKSYLRNHGLRNQCAIVADRFHRAILHRLLAPGFLFRRFWLFEDDGAHRTKTVKSLAVSFLQLPRRRMCPLSASNIVSLCLGWGGLTFSATPGKH